MRNNLDNFEKLIRDSAEEFEAPFDPKEWDRLEKRMDSASGGSGSGMKKFWIAAGITAVVLGGGLGWYLSNQPEQDSTIAEDNTLPEERHEHVRLEKDDNQKPQEQVQDTQENDLNSIDEQNNDQTPKVNNADNTDVADNTDINSTANDNDLNSDNNDEANETASDINDPNNVTDDTDENDEGNESLDHNSTSNITAPLAMFEANKLTVCAGDEVQFSPTEVSEGDYIWNFGDGKVSGKVQPKHKYSTPGQYIVTLETRSKKDNTVTDQSDGVLITVRETPDAKFSVERDANAARPVVHFINQTDKATQWSWNFKDGELSGDKNPDHIFNKKGTYNVELIATNEHGCSEVATKSINIENDYNLLAPKAVTPDGDGINEEWIPEALTVLDYPFTLTIYSKDGQQVFQSKSANNKWNGVDQTDGKMCEEGFYVWYVILTNEKGNTEEYKGTVMLMKQ